MLSETFPLGAQKSAFVFLHGKTRIETKKMFFQEKKIIVAKKIKKWKKKKERKKTVQWVTNTSFCDYRVSRALKKQELLSTAPQATLTLLSCSPNFPRAPITRYTSAKHGPIL